MANKTQKDKIDKENDLISIVVPVYNVEKYLNSSIESILNQTYKNIEVILIDDGSTDKSSLICDEFVEKDKRVRVVHQINGGLSQARNVGLSNCFGKYIMFVDSDDTIAKEMCEILLNNLKKNNCGISACSWRKIFDVNNYEKKDIIFDKMQNLVFKKEEVFDLIFNHKVEMIMSSWSKLYKRELFEGIVYPVGKIHEDEFVIHEILNKCKSFVYTPLEMYNNLQRNNSITGEKFNIKRFDALEARKNRVDFCKKNKPLFYQKALCQYLKTVCFYYYLTKKNNLDKNYLIKLNEEFNKSYFLLEKKPLSLRLFKLSKFLFCLLANFKRM